MDAVKNLVATTTKCEELTLELLDVLGGRCGRAGHNTNLRGVEHGLGSCRGIEGKHVH